MLYESLKNKIKILYINLIHNKEKHNDGNYLTNSNTAQRHLLTGSVIIMRRFEIEKERKVRKRSRGKSQNSNTHQRL